MADLKALQDDIEHVLKLIPTEVVEVVAHLAGQVLSKYREKLPEIAANAFFKLQPHVKALGLELSTGMMDLKELEPVLTNALENVVNEKARSAG